MTPATTGSFGPIVLQPGVTARHVICFLFAALISIGMFTYLMSLTPYLLTVNLGIPEAEHGRVIGNLQFLQEIVVIVSISWWGALSDRFGRRGTYVIGFLLMMVGYAIYAFATSLPQLFAFRVVYALAVAATTTNLSAILADYPVDQSRGKMTGLAFILNGIGAALFFGGLNQLPNIFQSQGIDELWAGRYAYLFAAGVAFVAAIVMLGLKPGRPVETHEKPPVLTLMREGLRAARNRRIGIAYLAAFASRADMAIVTLFFVLWVVQAGTNAGLTAAEAQAKAGIAVAIYSVAALLWAPVVGIIADKVDRLTLTVISFLFAVVGYGGLGLLDDVLTLSAVGPMLVLAGIGQTSTALAITVLLGQEAPANIRGSVFGMQSFFGAIGILAISWGGGQLFDLVAPSAPFIAVACANLLVFACAAAQRLAETRTSRVELSRG